MKPGPGDHPHRLLINGDELRELQRHTGSMLEAYGLDRKIENYKGSRPITLYSWDLDCLIDVISLALDDDDEYPDRSAPEYLALERLGERLCQEYESVYETKKTLSLSKSKPKAAKPAAEPAATPAARSPGSVYQFKITLLDTHPPIWRRIQVPDCTLDNLHTYIQAVMGWTNYHLHHFRIGKQFYGDPFLLQDNFEGMGYVDSVATELSDILPEGRKQLRIIYDYDFGDSWRHEVRYERKLNADAGKKYPLCVDGKRACPPEDVGGVWGYANFVEAVLDRKHMRHRELLEWVGGSFDPEAFDTASATREMHKRLPG